MIKGTYSNLSTDKLCKQIILLHNEIIPNCAKLSVIALCMQLTSIECERSFSLQNKLKTKQRASVGSEKLNTLMTIYSYMLGPLAELYDPTPAISYLLRKKKRWKGRLFSEYKKKGKRKVQGVPQSQTAALPRYQEEEEKDKTKQAQIKQTYEKH